MCQRATASPWCARVGFRDIVHCARGSIAVEAAIVVPILATLCFGAADGAWYFIQTHKMETGLTAGGTYLAQTRAETTDEARARNIAVTGMPSGGTPRVSGWSASDVTITYRSVSNNGLYRTAGNVRVARLETRLPYRGFGILSGARGGDLAVTASFETRITS